MQNRYPESDTQVQERAAKLQYKMMQRYKSSEQSVLHLVVTHGTLVRFFSQAGGMRKKKVKYCGLTAMGVKPNPDPT